MPCSTLVRCVYVPCYTAVRCVCVPCSTAVCLVAVCLVILLYGVFLVILL